MNTKDAIRASMNMSDLVLKSYLSDLSDSDLMLRPADGCNHLAWQLGHLINSEAMLVKSLSPDHAVSLPEGFGDTHSKEATGNDDASAFLKKDEYLALYDTVREASRTALADYPEETFDQPSPERLRKMFPTNGDVFTLIAMHPMMHAGQFVVIRRKLGKPVLI